MSLLTVLWIVCNLVTVAATLYSSLMRGRPTSPYHHARHVARLVMSSACLVCAVRAMQQRVVLYPELIVLAVALSVVMVTRAISEARRQRTREAART